MEYVFLFWALTLLVGLAVIWWITWPQITRASTVELQVAEFNRRVREWENADSDDR